VFTHLHGDRDFYLWCDLVDLHEAHGVLRLGPTRLGPAYSIAVFSECEHGLGVESCPCGATLVIHGEAECEHLVAALSAIPPHSSALVRQPGDPWGRRVEWVQP
jgi:hypothetical protein